MIQVYTGDGKGKTTAALGLALRAAGAGKKVYIAQFAKGRDYGELAILNKIKQIKIEQCGRRCFIKKRPEKQDIACAQAAWEKVKKIIAQKKYQLIVLDEINIALKLGLLSTKEVLSVIKEAPKDIEVVLTGRYAPQALIKIADLVSQIREIKHYYKKGVKARKGIEY